MSRLWVDFISGTLEEQLDALFSDTTLVSSGLIKLPALGGGDYVVGILGSNTSEPEIIHIVSHVADSDTATVERGKNIPPKTWQVGSLWHHGSVADDIQELRGPKGDTGDAWDAWEGSWSSGTAYNRLDVVSHESESWIANVDTVAGDEPGISSKWDLIAGKGSVDNVALNDLTDVDTSGAQTDHTLVRNGAGLWVPANAIPAIHGKSRHSDPTTGTLGTSGTVTVDFNTNNDLFTQALSGNVTYASSNRASGRSATIRINPGASNRTPTFPSGWKFFGSKPDVFEANTLYLMTLTCFGSADADVHVAVAKQVV